MPNRVEETPTEARQGDGRTMNFRVLVLSTLAVVVLFVVIYFVFFNTAPPGV